LKPEEKTEEEKEDLITRRMKRLKKKQDTGSATAQLKSYMEALGFYSSKHFSRLENMQRTGFLIDSLILNQAMIEVETDADSPK